MDHYRTITHRDVVGTKDAWSFEDPIGLCPLEKNCQIQIEVQGSYQDGYHLIISPEGFFTADQWYVSLDDAFAAAKLLFGTDRAEWELVC